MYWIANYLTSSDEGMMWNFFQKDQIAGISLLLFNSSVHGDSCFEIWELMKTKSLRFSILNDNGGDVKYSQGQYWFNLALQRNSEGATRELFESTHEKSDEDENDE